MSGRLILLDIFTNQIATYTGGVSQPLEWRETETSQLPSARSALQSARVDNILFVTGGWDDRHHGGHNYSTSILSWNPSSESWQHAGDLAVGRAYHAVVTVLSSILSSQCSDVLL